MCDSPLPTLEQMARQLHWHSCSLLALEVDKKTLYLMVDSCTALKEKVDTQQLIIEMLIKQVAELQDAKEEKETKIFHNGLHY